MPSFPQPIVFQVACTVIAVVARSPRAIGDEVGTSCGNSFPTEVGLPIEAVFVWMAVTYGTTIVFEIMKLWQASGRVAKDAFLGAAFKS